MAIVAEVLQGKKNGTDHKISSNNRENIRVFTSGIWVILYCTGISL